MCRLRVRTVATSTSASLKKARRVCVRQLRSLTRCVAHDLVLLLIASGVLSFACFLFLWQVGDFRFISMVFELNRDGNAVNFGVACVLMAVVLFALLRYFASICIQISGFRLYGLLPVTRPDVFSRVMDGAVV